MKKKVFINGILSIGLILCFASHALCQKKWIKIADNVSRVCLGENNLYFLDRLGKKFYKFNNSHPWIPDTIIQWTLIGSGGDDFAANLKTVFKLINSSNSQTIWEYTGTGTNWKDIGTPSANVTQLIAAGNAFFVGCKNDGIYRYDGVSGKWTKIGGPGWKFKATYIPGAFQNCELYGISPEGKGIWKYSGTPFKWQKIAKTHTNTGSKYWFVELFPVPNGDLFIVEQEDPPNWPTNIDTLYKYNQMGSLLSFSHIAASNTKDPCLTINMNGIYGISNGKDCHFSHDGIYLEDVGKNPGNILYSTMYDVFCFKSDICSTFGTLYILERDKAIIPPRVVIPPNLLTDPPEHRFTHIFPTPEPDPMVRVVFTVHDPEIGEVLQEDVMPESVLFHLKEDDNIQIQEVMPFENEIIDQEERE